MISFSSPFIFIKNNTLFLYFLLLCATYAQNTYAVNIKNGSDLVKQKNCASCHGADFNSPVVSGYPRLAGQKQDYLYAALLSYTSIDPNFGRSNAIMKGQVQGMSRQDMQDISAYLSKLPGKLILQK